MREPISSIGQAQRPAFDPAPPVYPQRRRARLLLVALPVLAVFAAFGLIVWLAYVSGGPGSAMGEPPLIKADASPLKLSPDDQGERAVAGQGELQGLLRDDPSAQPERLLPPPEEPMTPAGSELAQGEASLPPSSNAQVAAAPAGTAQEAEAPPDTGATSAAAPAGNAPGEGRTRAQQAPAAGNQGRRNDAGGIAGAPVAKPSADAAAALDSLFDEVSRANRGASAHAAASAGGAPARTTDAPGQAGAPAGTGPAAEEKLIAAQEALAEAKEQASPGRSAGAARAGAGGAAGAPAARQEPAAPFEVAATRPAGAAGERDPEARAQQQVAAAAAREPAPVRPASPSPAVDADGRFRIQLAAVREEADARRAWDLFQGDLGGLLGEAEPIIERAETANGVFYRLQIGPYAELTAAESLCEQLKERNASCFVVRR